MPWNVLRQPTDPNLVRDENPIRSLVGEVSVDLQRYPPDRGTTDAAELAHGIR